MQVQPECLEQGMYSLLARCILKSNKWCLIFTQCRGGIQAKYNREVL
jgi:hypothetical protein